MRALCIVGTLYCSFASINASAADTVTLNFVNADIDQVARALGSALGKTIVVDPRVKGQINLVSEQPVSEELAIKTLQATLRAQGYVLIEDHGLLKVVPEADAKLQSVPTVIGNSPQYRGDQVVTEVFTLHYESANNLLPVLRPLIAPNNSITAYPANNSLVITDYADNIRRIAAIIAGLDTPASAAIEVMQLKNANAVDLAATLQRLLDPGAIGNSDPTLKILVTADARTNSLVLRASTRARLDSARALVYRLDEPNREPGNMHVVHLKNADATKLAQTLRALMSTSGAPLGGSGGASSSANSGTATPLLSMPIANASPSGSAGLGGTSASGSSAGLSQGAGPSSGSFASSGDETTQGGGMIQADAATNSLLITAPDPVYRNLRAIIDQLDLRRAQIYIESLIVEVSTDKSAQFGVQWQGVTNAKGANSIAAGTNFDSGGQNIFDLTAGAYLGQSNSAAYVAPANGLNIGLIHRFSSILGLGGLLQALETNSGVNVLSTPNLVTLDNEEAKILIGQNVPFLTGAYAQTGSSSTVTPFQTYDRQDVGITLKVKPQISEGGIVKLQIYQESSSVVASSQSDPGGITTNKRSIQSTVLCDDGQIIVLGGLLQDSYNDGNSKVPWLGDLPVVGSLFRSESKSRSKTNLMVFLRPVIVRDAATSAAITQNRYDLVRSLGQTFESDNRLIKDRDTPLAPATPVTPLPGTAPVDAPFDLRHMGRDPDTPGAASHP